MTPWGDKSQSPCVFTPGVADAGGMSLGAGLELSDGRLGRPAGFLYFRLVTTAGAKAGNTTCWVSSIQLYDANGLFSPENMTQESQNGFVATQKGIYTSCYAWKAFDGDPATQSGQEPVAFPQWIKLQCPSAKKLVKFAVTSSGWNGDYTPLGMRIEGSNTGEFSGEEEVIGSFSVAAWANIERKEFTV